MSGAAVHRLLALLAVAAVLPAARLEGFGIPVAAMVTVFALLRAVARPSRRALVTRPLRLLLAATVALAALLTFYRLASGAGRPLVELLRLLGVLLVLALALRQRAFTTFLGILFSSALVAGAAFLANDPVALMLTVIAMALLVGTLVAFERHLAGGPARPPSARVAHVVHAGRAPTASVLWASAVLCVAGFLAGLVLYVAAPRGLFASGAATGAAPGAAEASGGGDVASVRGERSLFTTRPDAASKGIRLGDVGVIKRDLTPYFEVRYPEGEEPLLRENAYDRYQFDAEGRRVWTTSPELDGIARTAGPPGALDQGWVAAGPAGPSGARGRTIAVRHLLGGHRRLFLTPEPRSVRLLRAGTPVPVVLSLQANGQVETDVLLAQDDLVEARIVPPDLDRRRLAGARSDASVALPAGTWLDLPPECAPLVDAARAAVGDAASPFDRARRLVAWLRGPAFRYTLRMPEVDTRRPVVDFVLRRREGHCEYFAAALTLMLRGLGHPARIVRGFRGGDWQPATGTWLVRGAHYHAWTEMYLEEIGWVGFDATPPDREAVDATTTTRVKDARETTGERSVLDRLLAYGAEDRRALLERLAAGLRRVSRGAGDLVRHAPVPVALALLLLVGLGLHGRRRTRGGARGSGRGRRGHGASTGAYGRALELLARRGLRRRPAQTPRELAALVARRFPEAAGPLDLLTEGHEVACYAGGGARDPARRARSSATVRDLKRALARGAGGEADPGP